MPKRKKRNSGQLAIFIALIFQMVFILFAMSLNVALVVHDKINLQNSVDLAAYYGAMKQAQTLNAIAHINYQIRQSWKLLAWRYRIMGNPYASTTSPAPRNDERSEFHPNTGAKKVYIVCTAYSDKDDKGWGAFRLPDDSTWNPGGRTDPEVELCSNIDLSISGLTIPPGGSTYLGALYRAIQSTARVGNNQIDQKCKAYNYTNWLFAVFSLYHFRVDQSRKAQLIYKIADQIAGRGMEIDSQQEIYRGAEQTFMNNLTYINQRSFDLPTTSRFETFDSLEKSYGPNDWLSPESFYVYPLLYVSTTGSGGNCSAKGEQISNLSAQSQATNSAFKELAIQITTPPLTDPGLCKDLGSDYFCEPSAGLSKKDGFIVYFGARAELEYKNQIFLPFFNNKPLKLKAQAFAKPFGGRIGPKYDDDQNLPERSGGALSVSLQFASKNSPNYAKYPGDDKGLASHYVQRQWATPIYGVSRSDKSIEYYIPSSFPPLTPLSENDKFKKWELAAVAPDLFDITYFTILPSYMDTYYKNLQNWGFNPPPDFSVSDGGGIKQQINISYSRSLPGDLFYKIKEPAHLLTGWNPPKQKYEPDRYPANISETHFADCSKWDYRLDPDGNSRIATGCVQGGRTGYSVKMIHKDHLRSIVGGSTPPPGPGWNW